MTRTRPPEILTSALHHDITFKRPADLPLSLQDSKQCDLKMLDKSEIINKRHCRSFDFIESLDDPQPFSSSMEYHHKRPERHTLDKKLWNGLEQPGHLRFSSPDLFNTKQFQQQDKSSYMTWSDSSKRLTAKSASRLKGNLTPVSICVSQPEATPEAGAAVVPPRTSGSQRDPSSRLFLDEVHPIKLQARSPLYVSDCFEENRADKAAVSPHVRCRVDIKPDAAVLEHTWRQIHNSRDDRLWQRYSQASSRAALYVPRQTVSSPTPTPSECLSGDFRQGYGYTTSTSPRSYQHLDMQRMASPTGLYLKQEQRAHSNPNIPTKFFYTEDAVRYPTRPYSRAYFQDDRSSLTSFGSTITSQCDPRTRLVHTLPVRSYYTDHCTNREPGQSGQSRPYSTSDGGPYFPQTPPPRTHCGEEGLFSPHNISSSRLFYSKPFNAPDEQYFISRPYHTEGHRRPRLPHSFSSDWYRSGLSGYSNHFSQMTPLGGRPEPTLSPWIPDRYTEATHLGADVKGHSKSWDNIRYPMQSTDQSMPRGRSYENLFHQAGYGTPCEITAKPVILNLSSSPRRYAALSVSENSLERNLSKPWIHSKSGHWFVTPEITITDNDICGGSSRLRDGRSVSWDCPNAEKTPTLTVVDPVPCDTQSTAEITKDRKHNNFSLQQSLEQLDELLADLVVDYKPPSTKKSGENLLDQLKHLITEEDETDRHAGLKNCRNTEFPSCKSSPDTIRDPDSGCDALQRNPEESPEHSTDEDDTMMCANNKCNRMETTFNACLYFKSCHSCYTFYCSRNCRRDDWDTHKLTCLYGRVSSVCRHALRFCRESSDIHKAFSRVAKAGYLSRGRGVLFLGFANPDTAENFLHAGLESLLMSPTYLSLRELGGFKDNLGEYCKELQQAGNEYDPNECFLLNVSIAVGELVPNRPSPRVQTPTVRKYAKVSLASSSPDRNVLKKEDEMETLILTPPPGTPDLDKDGEEGRKAREVCFVNIQRELRGRGVFLRHEYPTVYEQLCEFVENNKRFTPTSIYPVDKRTGKQFLCMIMAASEPRTLDWLVTPHLLDDII